MSDNFGVGNFADVAVIRAVTIWDYLLFFGTFAAIGIVGFLGIRFAWKRTHKNNLDKDEVYSYEKPI
jgi:hypothetical protein